MLISNKVTKMIESYSSKKNYENLFLKSFIKYQTLINTIIEYENEKGICVVSQIELAQKLSLSQTTISKLINRLNVEDMCVEIVSPGKYIIHYKNLLERGTFSCIWNLLCTFQVILFLHTYLLHLVC